MPAQNALISEPQFAAARSGFGPLTAAAPRTELRAKVAADLAQLVSELGDELVRYHADRRLRLDRTPLPPATEVLLVATIPASRAGAAGPLVEADGSASLRAATTVTIRRRP